MEQHTVIVENGSGILIQPMTTEYSYILTAKHVLEITHDEEETTNTKTYLHSEEVKVISCKGQIAVREIYLHPTADLAILIIDTFENLSLKVSSTSPRRNDEVIVIGCPGTRRTPTKADFRDYIRDIEGQVRRLKISDFEIESSDRPSINELKGMSGCGIFIEVNGDCYLCGIETSLSGEIGEYHGRIKGVSLLEFDSLISKGQYLGKELAELLPPHLFCLSKSINSTFLFKGSAIKQVSGRARDYLQNFAKKSITTKTPPPFALRKNFSKQLIEKESTKQGELEEGFWSNYLEYLVIGLIAKDEEEISEEFIEQLKTHRYFLYSGSEQDWIDLLPQILEIEIPTLGNNAAVVIATKNSPISASLPEIPLERIVSRIDSDAHSEFNIGCPIRKIKSDTKLLHIEGVSRNAIIQNELTLDGLDTDTFVQHLRGNYCDNF